jgi:hypothetical protein
MKTYKITLKTAPVNGKYVAHFAGNRLEQTSPEFIVEVDEEISIYPGTEDLFDVELLQESC